MHGKPEGDTPLVQGKVLAYAVVEMEVPGDYSNKEYGDLKGCPYKD